jgi:putative ABC transport system permease protein
MRFWPLLRANLGRHKRRTFLTMASVALALFLFASLRTVITTLKAAAEFGSARRLVSTNASGLIFPLPVAYAQRLQTVPGVEKVTWANWFGGQYGDGKRFFANFAVDAKSYLDLYPEMSVPADQREAFFQDRSGALIGARLVDLFGWKVGQNVTLRGTIYPGDWTFTVRGVYTPTDPVINDDAMMFHWRAGTSCRLTGRRTGRASQRRSTTCSRARARPPRPAPSRRSTRASPPCGATWACS